MPLGETLVAAKVISQAQLDEALAIQKTAAGKKLGEIIIEKGWADAAAIEKALKG